MSTSLKAMVTKSCPVPNLRAHQHRHEDVAWMGTRRAACIEHRNLFMPASMWLKEAARAAGLYGVLAPSVMMCG